MIAEIEFDYSTKLTPEQLALLKEISFSSATIEVDEATGILKWNSRNPMVELIKAGPLAPFKILRMKTIEATSVQETKAIVDRLEVLAANSKREIMQNSKTGSPVSNLALYEVSELLLVEDACTDGINGKLDDGWRIVAICPQPQRRPDYILGKFFKTR